MDIILQAGLPHQQIPVDRIAHVFSRTQIEPPRQLHQNPMPEYQSAQLTHAIREIISTKEMKPYNHKVVEPAPGESLNIDIKMETGTGKTYVYTHTLYELHKRYGFNKFVILVHSLAVKAGVVQFISDPYVQRYFKDTLGYGSEIDLCEVTPAKKKKKGHSYFPSSVRDFVNGSYQNRNRIYVLVVNQQLMQKGKLLDKRDYDIAVQSFHRPLDAIKSTRPIVLIDEPHRFERSNTTYKFLLSEVAPQCVIRFGATFPEVMEGKGKNKHAQKDYLNLLYNLTACEAFNQNLIKGVAKEHFNPLSSENEKVKVVSINGKESVIFHHIKQNTSQRYELHKGESLGLMSDSLSGIVLSGIKSGEIELSNGQLKHTGDEFAADIYSTSYQEQMIRLAIERHFEVERAMFHRESKIKTLALFFIDNIESFRGDENGQGAWLKDLFDRLLEERLKEELGKENSESYTSYLQASLDDIAACRGGYFAQDNSDSDEAIDAEVKDILQNKKKLLSFKDENGNWYVRRFLFSKWTLKEGWDNPNVFTITKLRSSGSEISKLQEVGRGLRLPVDEYGNRINGSEFMLNYIVDFTEKDFADRLVSEINSDVYKTDEPIKLTDAELERVAALRGLDDYRALWIEIIQKGYLKTDMTLVEDKIMDFRNEYPEFNLDGINSGRIINKNAKNNKDMVKVRPDNFKKIEELWKDINRKYLLYYHKEIDGAIEKALPSILEEGVFSKLYISSDRSEVEISNGQAVVVHEANVSYQVTGRAIPYNEFLKRANKATHIPVVTLHKAICNYARVHSSFGEAQLNETSLAQLIARFNDWKIDNLAGDILYKQANYRTKVTALTNKDGSMRDEVVMGRLGVKTDNSKVPDEYLYEPIAYDSPLERQNILDKVNVAELVVYGKIPKGSIRIPTVANETYSPDFMYIVRTKEGKLMLNVVIETKDVNQNATLRKKEDVKIDCAELFFKQLTKDFPNLPVKFKRQINMKKINSIIGELVESS